jgi:hypothetical protein
MTCFPYWEVRKKMYIIHAPGGLGYYLAENTQDNLSTHVWHHGNYGLQRARLFKSKSQALAVISSGFKDAGGHPARVVKVSTRTAFCATTQVGRKVYWLCPSQYPLPQWRTGPNKSYDAQRFNTPSLAQEAARRVRVPEGAAKIKIVSASEIVLEG